MKIHDLMNIGDLQHEIRQGYVRLQWHPSSNTLAILNYAEKTQFERRWNDVTRQCRGLIFDVATDEVLARPFDKFFNYGELDMQLDLDRPVRMTDKMDGSLGILYPGPDGWAIATRGSFASEQAIEGTRMLREWFTQLEPGYVPCVNWEPLPGLTYLFEIIYPENRIVLDYGAERSLVLLGTRDIDGGGYVSAQEWAAGWPSEVAPAIEAYSLREALELSPRPNAEGVVVEYGDTLIKIKQDDYVALHRIVTGLSERTVYDHLVAGKPLAELLEPLPEEFEDWVRKVAAELDARAEELINRAHIAYADVTLELDLRFGETWTRADFAKLAKDEIGLTPFLFQLLDGRDIRPAVWKTLRPKGSTGPNSTTVKE